MGKLGDRVRSDKLSVAIAAQIWDNVRMTAGLLEEQQLADALRRNREFLNLVAVLGLNPNRSEESR